VSWSMPSGCVGSTCDYRAEWSLDAVFDVITFTIIAKQSVDRWTGRAFAPEPEMVPKQAIWRLHYTVSCNRIITCIDFLHEKGV